MADKLKITLVKSTIGAVPKNRKTVEALGLTKINKTVEMPDNAAVRGMIQKVRHLVKVDIKGRQDIIVTMRSGVVALSDVVVIGYGEASRRTITSSISKVKGDVLSDMSISSPVEGLKGRISGVRVVQTNNTPGGGFSIKVRGGSSITQSNEPLVLVDGVERSMNDITPEDISSIDVLKDAASTAIYGARGSNGVILISTKKG